MVKKMTSKLDCADNRSVTIIEQESQIDESRYSEDEAKDSKSKTKRGRKNVAKPRKNKKEVKQNKRAKKNNKAESEIEQSYCEIHKGNRIDFICTYPRFIQEMCSYCILEHKKFIHDIHPINMVVDKFKTKLDNESIPQIQDKINVAQGENLGKLEKIQEKIRDKVNVLINRYKETLISDDHHLSDSINNIIDFKNHFIDGAKQIQENLKNNVIDKRSLIILKKYMQDRKVEKCNGFIVETNLLLQQIERALENNITYVQDACVVNSTNEGVQKYLHWFEWEKRDLHLFDVTRYTHKTIRLVIPFKIHPFSRSIITPNGYIYLLGGEDKIEGAKKEVYCFNTATSDTDKTLYNKPSMPHKKYDFTLCYLDSFIYVICGKNVDNEIVRSCERYCIENESWSICSSVNVKRYAASAATIKEKNRIYLFGGRGEAQNAMINEIEEYCVETDNWRILDINWPNEWKPVEVCATIQLKKDEIIIFGGSDVNVEDSKDTYVFKSNDCKLEKVDDLKKPHVFVSAPFIYGNYVFAVGNEYYVKSRNIHRFDIARGKWEIVF